MYHNNEIDFSDFTKSDRERSDEALLNWRSTGSGWRVERSTRRFARPLIIGMILSQGLLLAAAFYYFGAS